MSSSMDPFPYHFCCRDSNQFDKEARLIAENSITSVCKKPFAKLCYIAVSYTMYRVLLHVLTAMGGGLL